MKLNYAFLFTVVFFPFSGTAQSDPVPVNIDIPIPEGFQQVYFEKVTVDQSSYYRVGFLHPKSGEMVDVVLDSDNNSIDRVPKSKKTKKKISDAAKLKLNKLLNEIGEDEKENKVTLDIGLSIPSIPWQQKKGFTGSASFDSSSRVTMTQNGKPYDKQAAAEIKKEKKSCEASISEEKKPRCKLS